MPDTLFVFFFFVEQKFDFVLGYVIGVSFARLVDAVQKPLDDKKMPGLLGDSLHSIIGRPTGMDSLKTKLMN